MAFAPLRQASSSHSRTEISNEIKVAVFGAKTGKYRQAHITIPRSILRDADLPDFPGATMDILIGTGVDAGSIALISGSRFKLFAQGNGKHRVMLRTALIATDLYRAKSADFDAGHKQLIVHLPRDFPLAPDAADLSVGSSPTRALRTTNGVAA